MVQRDSDRLMMYSHPIGKGRSSVCSAVSFILYLINLFDTCLNRYVQIVKRGINGVVQPSVGSRSVKRVCDFIRVGLVRTDASCVRPMGYLAIFFCVFSSVLLASLRFCPSEGRK